MRKKFRDTFLELAKNDERIVAIFGDISVYLFNEFAQQYKNRFYNLGICENSLISVSAGLSAQGYIPFVHSIAPFITERCLEQIKLDFCYNNFPGNIVSCGATFDYAWDGATHHCLTDIAALRELPNIQIFQPGSTEETEFLIKKNYNSTKTNYYRLSDHSHKLKLPNQQGGMIIKNNNSDITVVTAGPILDYIMQATQDISVNIVYFNTIKPINIDLIKQFQQTKLKIIHDSSGLLSAICEKISGKYHIEYLGMPDYFCCEYGKIENVRQYAGLGVEEIKNFIKFGKK